VGVVGALGADAGLLPNNHFHNRTTAPSWTVSTGAGAGSATGTGTGIGIGMMGAVDAGRMLGTNGASPCGFLSRLPMLESSRTG
jgi:hypothetical protein